MPQDESNRIATNDDLVDGLAKRVADLERRLAEQQSRPLSEIEIDAALHSLGRSLDSDNHPHNTYLNARFRQYEWAMRNVKQLGYEMGRLLAEKNGLGRYVASPPKTELKSSLCTQADCDSDWFAFWMREIKATPYYHRKLWEFAYIAQALYQKGKMAPGMRGLGFGCGHEPMPSLLAKYGAQVMATDLHPDRPEAQGWASSDQHAAQIEAIQLLDICPDKNLLANISFRFVDMNDIPADLGGQFDFCWSACALEHLGSINNGLAFIENSLKTLKPGGIAVHTTEFNLEDGETLDNWPTVLFQCRHFEDFAAHLVSKGHTVEPLDFNPGNSPMDRFVDIPPFDGGYYASELNWAHLRLCGDGFPCTSVGIIITKG
jgi:2-polyprenyl-3-methyl-5-hydroxy-6-metoxy-1,4-benzoquinol methylase